MSWHKHKLHVGFTNDIMHVGYRVKVCSCMSSRSTLHPLQHARLLLLSSMLDATLYGAWLHHTHTHTNAEDTYIAGVNKTAALCPHQRQCNHHRRSCKIETTRCRRLSFTLPHVRTAIVCLTCLFACVPVSPRCLRVHSTVYFIIIISSSPPSHNLIVVVRPTHTQTTHALDTHTLEQANKTSARMFVNAHRHGYSCDKLREQRAENVVGAQMIYFVFNCNWSCSWSPSRRG